MVHPACTAESCESKGDHVDARQNTCKPTQIRRWPPEARERGRTVVDARAAAGDAAAGDAGVVRVQRQELAGAEEGAVCTAAHVNCIVNYKLHNRFSGHASYAVTSLSESFAVVFQLGGCSAEHRNADPSRARNAGSATQGAQRAARNAGSATQGALRHGPKCRAHTRVEAGAAVERAARVAAAAGAAGRRRLRPGLAGKEGLVVAHRRACTRPVVEMPRLCCNARPVAW